MTPTSDRASLIPDATADFEDMGCGDLAIALMDAMKPLQVGQVLKVRALDSGAVEDIPAWCRMRGHTLLLSPDEQDHEHYYIQKGA
jgi:tRNA 2-thiouridine synthesizing protein A